MLENPAPPSLEFSSPMRSVSMETSSHVNPPPPTLPINQKNPPENVCTLPNSNYYM